MLYLHGVCGNVYAMHPWAQSIAGRVTTVALLGDGACGGGRYRWSAYVPSIHERAQRALASLAEEGVLGERVPLAVFGYSQGATRAEKLASMRPHTYTHVVLGSPPMLPNPAHFAHVSALAVTSGEREDGSALERRVHEIAAAGVRARYFELPGAGHGEFGPRAAEVMRNLIEWLYAEP